MERDRRRRARDTIPATHQPPPMRVILARTVHLWLVTIGVVLAVAVPLLLCGGPR